MISNANPKDEYQKNRDISCIIDLSSLPKIRVTRCALMAPLVGFEPTPEPLKHGEMGVNSYQYDNGRAEAV